MSGHVSIKKSDTSGKYYWTLILVIISLLHGEEELTALVNTLDLQHLDL